MSTRPSEHEFDRDAKRVKFPIIFCWRHLLEIRVVAGIVKKGDTRPRLLPRQQTLWCTLDANNIEIT
jgi:hypothetical protein